MSPSSSPLFSLSQGRMSSVIFFVILLLLLPSFGKVPPPWITYLPNCGYENCVEIDFSLVKGNFTGDSLNFNELFLLTATEGGEDGTDSCTKPDPETMRCLYDPKNVKIENGVLQLWVPGGTKKDETISTSQVIFSDPSVKNSTFVLSGHFSVEARTSPVPGTCHGIFTQANPGYPIQKDEQDIEILTGHYTINSSLIPAGIQITSWNASPQNDSMEGRQVNFTRPYNFDPTSNFHTYSITWNKNYTIYNWGEQFIRVGLYSSQNPSILTVNNWSDGSPGWTEGPPKKDNILEIRKIRAYYNTRN